MTDTPLFVPPPPPPLPASVSRTALLAALDYLGLPVEHLISVHISGSGVVVTGFDLNSYGARHVMSSGEAVKYTATIPYTTEEPHRG